MQFKDVEIGEDFVVGGHIYTKMEETNIPRYGIVNAHGPATYNGDLGYRHFYDDVEVEPVEAFWSNHIRVLPVV